MGPLAAAVKPALVKMYERGDTYDDPAYVALGKIALDAKPGSLEDSLKQLGKVTELPPDQVSAAFLNVVRLGMIVDLEDMMKSEAERIDQEVARAARPVLLKVVREHSHDAHGRAALRALAELGPGGDPEMVKLLINLIIEYREALSRLNEIRITLPPGPKRDSVEEEFSRLIGQYLEKHVSATLVKL